jgi:hypothetical protein
MSAVGEARHGSSAGGRLRRVTRVLWHACRQRVVWCRGKQVRAAAAAAVSYPCHGRARASKETEGDRHGQLADPTRQASSPPSDSIPAKFSYFSFARYYPEGVR